MFTGIIQQTGSIRSLKGGRLTVTAGKWARPFELGESISISGVCLTLTAWTKTTMEFDLLSETLQRTNLATVERVNLERALRAGDAIGGHFLTGHVDGTGRVRKLSQVKKDWILEIACSKKLAAGIVEKGSIAVDGVSLTVVDARRDGFAVHLIPHTWAQTTLSDLTVGSVVNLETDMLGKYIQRRAKR